MKVLLLKKFEIIFASSRFSPARTEAVEKFSETSSAKFGPDNTNILFESIFASVDKVSDIVLKVSKSIPFEARTYRLEI